MSNNRIELYERWHAHAQKYFQWQFLQFRPYIGNRIADIGCGLGNLTGFMENKEFYVGIDYNEEIINIMRGRYSNISNIEFSCQSILSPVCVDSLRSKNLDTIICINTLEHIEDDIKALNNMLNIVSSGKLFCLLVPAFNFLYGTLDILDGHFRRYNKKKILDMFNTLPVEIIRMYYFNLPGSLGWLLKGRILKQKEQYVENYQFMNMLVPLASRIEGWCAPPFGLSLIVIASKK